MSRGWSRDDLKTVGANDSLWTVAEAVFFLGSPRRDDPEEQSVTITQTLVRQLISVTGMEPVGKRRTSRYDQPARYAKVYRAGDFIAAYEALSCLFERLALRESEDDHLAA